ncbi:MAG: hypothetical protein U9R03_04545 [Candidatus Aerophobetes bacterium]|nr:hypothetical protein [Candidatus Aerophobetes bacterium]
MKKAFFINGGAGRVLCAIPALEHYAKNIDNDIIIIAEGWYELYLTSSILMDKVYSVDSKGIFNLVKDREIVSPEPYRLNEYYNQKCNLIQAFDIIINGYENEGIPTTKFYEPSIYKADHVKGYSLVQQTKHNFQKDKVIVFQPFGSSVKQEGNIIYDESGRSFELQNVIQIAKELSKEYAVIMMSQLDIPTNEQINVMIPQNINILEWHGIISCSDYFLGCDSVGQHIANFLKKPSTVVIGSTFPENISYQENELFDIIDMGEEKRKYSPIRITTDITIERNNEELMYMESEDINKIIDNIKSKLGKNKYSNQEQTKLCCSDGNCK